MLQNYALSGHKDYMHAFIAFTVKYEEKIAREEQNLFFGCRRDQMECELENRKTTQELYHIFAGK